MSYTDKLNEFKDRSGLTNQQIAEKSGVPIGTVNRIMAGQTDNPSFEAITAIVKAIGGSLDELVGINMSSRKSNAAADDRIVFIYEKQIEDINKNHEKQIKDKNTWIKMLFALLSALLLAIISLFIYDFTHPDRGWYIRETMQMAYAKLF